MANLEELGRTEHHKLIRESSEYRMFLKTEDLRNEMEPPLTLPERDNSILDENVPPPPPWGGGRVSKRIDELSAKLNYLQNKLNEHLDKKKGKDYAY